MAWDGAYFWIACDYNFANIHMIAPNGEERRYFRISGFQTGGIEHPTGMVAVGDQLWIGENPNEGFENNVASFDKEGHLLNSFDTKTWGIQPVSWPEYKVLAWDGNYLWYSADDLFKVYKLDILAAAWR